MKPDDVRCDDCGTLLAARTPRATVIRTRAASFYVTGGMTAVCRCCARMELPSASPEFPTISAEIPRTTPDVPGKISSNTVLTSEFSGEQSEIPFGDGDFTGIDSAHDRAVRSALSKPTE